MRALEKSPEVAYVYNVYDVSPMNKPRRTLQRRCHTGLRIYPAEYRCLGEAYASDQLCGYLMPVGSTTRPELMRVSVPVRTSRTYVLDSTSIVSKRSERWSSCCAARCMASRLACACSRVSKSPVRYHHSPLMRSHVVYTISYFVSCMLHLQCVRATHRSPSTHRSPLYDLPLLECNAPSA